MFGVSNQPMNDVGLTKLQTHDSVLPGLYNLHTPIGPIDMSDRGRANLESRDLWLRSDKWYPTVQASAVESQLRWGAMTNKRELYRPLLQRPYTVGYKGAGSGTPGDFVGVESHLYHGVGERALSRVTNPVRESSTRWQQPLPAFGNPQHPDRIILPGVRGGLMTRGNDPFQRQISLASRWKPDLDPYNFNSSGVQSMAGYVGLVTPYGESQYRTYWDGRLRPM